MRYSFVKNGISNLLITPCTLNLSDYETNSPDLKIKKGVSALWDTGATISVISTNLVQELGLIPIDVKRVSGFVGSSILAKSYIVDLEFGNLKIGFTSVVEAPLIRYDMIIGMDIMGMGDIHVTHPKLSTVFEFVVE